MDKWGGGGGALHVDKLLIHTVYTKVSTLHILAINGNPQDTVKTVTQLKLYHVAEQTSVRVNNYNNNNLFVHKLI